MKLNAVKFGLATGIAFAVIWTICSIIGFLMPLGMTAMSGPMVHGDFNGMQWRIGFGSLIMGLMAWTIAGGLTGWLIAWTYNWLLIKI